MTAHHPDFIVDHHQLPVQITEEEQTRTQKREELESEVTTLRKMLDHEKKVHEILEHVHFRQGDSDLHIPNFLPPKMKELLAELAMVEDEIARLESQVKQLQTDLNHDKEATKELKTKQFQQGNLNKPHGLTSSIPPSPIPTNKSFNEKVAFETKALHFISKAIKGDYNLNDFSLNHEKLMSPRRFSYQKENHIQEEVGMFREKLLKSSVLKPSSPLREPRNPTPRRDRNFEIPLDFPPKSLSSSVQPEEESIIKWTPNKLSENIMKCLIFIFVRLLRNSRATELEKSGPISRSTNFSLSFRAEPSSNSKTSLMLQKDSRQQDPYGIFDVEDSIPRDIGPYKNLVRFTSISLDPKLISSPSSIPLLQKLRVLMSNLQKADLQSLTDHQKLAFWINMYNACIMHGYLQYGVPSTPEKLLMLMKKATLNIGGNTMNAQAIEHYILRKPASFTREHHKVEKDDKETIVRELYGLSSPDPNITFALCCGTRSSPAVKIYTVEGIVAELEKSKLEYLQASVVVTGTRKIGLPELLFRNMHDFAQTLNLLVEWVCHQLPTSCTLRKSMVECCRGLNNAKLSSTIEKIPYQFEFQYLIGA